MELHYRVEGKQLTGMNAKCGGRVATSRRGKAAEMRKETSFHRLKTRVADKNNHHPRLTYPHKFGRQPS